MLKLGIDVGSTTVKTVVLNGDGIIHDSYERHNSKVRETIIEQLKKINERCPDEDFAVCITGSAGLGISEKTGLQFVQEVHASFSAVKRYYPETDVVIELGGEDAKIIFLTGGTEQRMNGSCAGGTGAFIDQMATLLNITPDNLDELALKAENTYPIASRCGVFAKSDIQPLLNQGAKHTDIAASVFQAVVDQTIGGLAAGRAIKGNVLFLGGPLFFFKALRKSFVKTLNLKNAVNPGNSTTFVALGAALSAKPDLKLTKLTEITELIENKTKITEKKQGKSLFANQAEYTEFINRHKLADVKFKDVMSYSGETYLGIDAGSTTTKMVLITPDGKLLYHFYADNKGQPLDKITEKLKELYSFMSPNLVIKAAAVTGYGEELIKAGIHVDYGVVETVAHFTAAKFFCPKVDFIIDIGGQDIKCFKVKNNSIDSIMLNEACSSGCGSFIQTFASALGYGIADFSQLGLFAENLVDLGSRCTVFMNSSVKQAQKDGATVGDISAGLSSSIIKNAIYKVIRAKSVDELGEHIVVQGGTFLNDAVLRAFELELGKNVIRPSIAGLMGAFGAALFAMQRGNRNSKSSILTKKQLNEFSYTSKNSRCKGCTSNCQLNIVRFADGGRFISGNKCSVGAGVKKENTLPNIYDYKLSLLQNLIEKSPNTAVKRGNVGLPFALEFFELLPFWKTFFESLKYNVIVSDLSTRETYTTGQATVPSDTVCYPAKLVHGHIENLLKKGVDFIFYPCMTYNLSEGGDNNYNCPIIAYYPETLKANNTKLNDRNFIHPYIDLNRKKGAVSTLSAVLKIPKTEIEEAVDKGFLSLKEHRREIVRESVAIINQARKERRKIIVLAGRPYHVDPEVNHGIYKIITECGMAVVSEYAISKIYNRAINEEMLQVVDQWTYHGRLYKSARYVTTQPDMQLIQLVSFGCGIDAVTTDEVRRILEEKGKIYTQIKIDEISNLGAAKIRIRSLEAVIA